MIHPIKWEKGTLFLLDQRRLPHKLQWFRASGYKGVIYAIKNLVVRGAPAIGLAAAFGMVLAFRSLRKRDPKTLLLKLKKIAEEFLRARPTAVNLRWAVLEMTKVGETSIGDGLTPEDCLKALESRALSLLEEDIRVNKAIGDFGAELIRDGSTILTHCNAGALATGGYGTALGVIRSAHLQGKRIRVLVDETRPWLQGHRLTAWELTQEGIEHYVIVDSAAGYFMAKGEVDMVVTGADRIAKNGDTANKIGTYSLAVLARENHVPFYIAAPTSTIDLTIPSGREIQVEVRSEEEVLLLEKKRIGPKGTKALNPVFDITPARLITGIITELGIATAPFERGIAELFSVHHRKNLGTGPKI